jgi:hypothetical protein
MPQQGLRPTCGVVIGTLLAAGTGAGGAVGPDTAPSRVGCSAYSSRSLTVRFRTSPGVGEAPSPRPRFVRAGSVRRGNRRCSAARTVATPRLSAALASCTRGGEVGSEAIGLGCRVNAAEGNHPTVSRPLPDGSAWLAACGFCCPSWLRPCSVSARCCSRGEPLLHTAKVELGQSVAVLRRRRRFVGDWRRCYRRRCPHCRGRRGRPDVAICHCSSEFQSPTSRLT